MSGVCMMILRSLHALKSFSSLQFVAQDRNTQRHTHTQPGKLIKRRNVRRITMMMTDGREGGNLNNEEEMDHEFNRF